MKLHKISLYFSNLFGALFGISGIVEAIIIFTSNIGVEMIGVKGGIEIFLSAIVTYVSIYNIFIMKKKDASFMNSSSFFLIAIIGFSTLFMTMINLSTIKEDNPIFFISISYFFIYVFYMLIFFAGIDKNKKKGETKKEISYSFISSLVFLVITTIYFVLLRDYSLFRVLSFVFTSLVSISLFISSIFYFFIFKEGLTQVENQNKDLLNSQEFSNISNFNENRYSSLSSSAIEMLRELKRLKDEGVISEEEYNEKRKKYIDKL